MDVINFSEGKFGLKYKVPLYIYYKDNKTGELYKFLLEEKIITSRYKKNSYGKTFNRKEQYRYHLKDRFIDLLSNKWGIKKKYFRIISSDIFNVEIDDMKYPVSICEEFHFVIGENQRKLYYDFIEKYRNDTIDNILDD